MNREKPLVWLHGEVKASTEGGLMRNETRKKLESAGWRVGDTTEFLGLSEVEAEVVEIKLALADLLRQVRARHHLTQTELAKRIHSSQSRVAKAESGDTSVSLDLLIKSLLAAGVENKELAGAVGGIRR
jgi:DNA-binding XRE family transcriptional regulator